MQFRKPEYFASFCDQKTNISAHHFSHKWDKAQISQLAYVSAKEVLFTYLSAVIEHVSPLLKHKCL